jgi:DNA invertase Pin-like site-specific DNA recombinase
VTGPVAHAGQLVGYVRVSTTQQTHAQQVDALTAAGVTGRIFDDKMSGRRADRPGFLALLNYVRPGDTVVVVGFDRFGRSTAQVFTTLADLLSRGIHVRGLREQVDTSTPHGRMVAGLFIVIAEWERELIAERAAVARQAAQDRGLQTGRPRKLSAADARVLAKLHAAGEPMGELAARFGCGKSTAYRAIASAIEPGEVR